MNFKTIGPPSQRRYRYVAVACVAAVGAHLLLPRGSVEAPVAPKELHPRPGSSPGWQDLGACSHLISLDETKKLKLLDDQRAILRVKQIDPKGQSVEGRWAYDEDAKRYAVTLNGNTATYTAISLPGWSELCLFVTGDITAANLHASWVSDAGQMDDESD